MWWWGTELKGSRRYIQYVCRGSYGHYSRSGCRPARKCDQDIRTACPGDKWLHQWGKRWFSRRNSKDITLSHRLSHTLSTQTFPTRGSVCVISGCTSITISTTNSAFCSAVSYRHKQGCNKCLSISNAWDENLDLWSLRWRTIWMIDLY